VAGATSADSTGSKLRDILQKKNIFFFHGGGTVEVDSVCQTELATALDSLQNLRFAMLKIAFSNIN